MTAPGCSPSTPASGRTVGVTTCDADATDVEALAPAGDGEVWVGDIGDNAAARDSVSVTRVPVGSRRPVGGGGVVRLVYPDGAGRRRGAARRTRATGRLFVVTKGVFGGEVYAAPSALRADATQHAAAARRRAGHRRPTAAFFPDGRHLIAAQLRPGVRAARSRRWTWSGSFDLPAQKQGEGIAVAADGSVYASSEGVRSPVLRIAVPDDIRAAIAAPAEDPSPSAGHADDQRSEAPGVGLPDASEPQRSAWPWLAGFLFFFIGLVVLVRALRPR